MDMYITASIKKFMTSFATELSKFLCPLVQAIFRDPHPLLTWRPDWQERERTASSQVLMHAQDFSHAFHNFTSGTVTYTKTAATNVFPQETLSYQGLQEESEVCNSYCSSGLPCHCWWLSEPWGRLFNCTVGSGQVLMWNFHPTSP